MAGKRLVTTLLVISAPDCPDKELDDEKPESAATEEEPKAAPLENLVPPTEDDEN